ncbi:MAG: DUF1848 family protein, partial [bacterium]
RRTDIPAHYYDWLVESFQSGVALVSRPYRRGTVEVDLRPDRIHTIVFWSKDFSHLLSDRERWNPYNLYFQFTLNHCPELEPNVPPLDGRLEQLRVMAGEWGAERINWRFDPIVFWDGGKRNNLADFERIAETAASMGIRRCTFSFMTHYGKTKSRDKALGMAFYDPVIEEKIEIASQMALCLAGYGMVLCACCNPEMVGIEGIQSASCVDGSLLARLAGESCDERKDSSQRKPCGCTRSIEIGSYWMKCPHACLYCYARPVTETD